MSKNDKSHIKPYNYDADYSDGNIGEFLMFVLVALFFACVLVGVSALEWDRKTPEQRKQYKERILKSDETFEYSPSFHYFGSKIIFF